ncbi:probable RNA methyltransferase CG11342 [Tribolium castaneum]|nr:PREDICTED: probable RNA methyltransferase CG11342 [Tribolium castaneum]|eukprot:XP_970967.2 PREDICTED: probable RNA methyltransferase CG11342 [Tribolium castaneum]
MTMENSKLSFKGGNPGAVQYGNFINYYQFHPPENRLKLLPTDLWPNNKPFHVLDLGCNAGDLTIELYNFLKGKVQNCEILGVDIDPTLVERANEKNQNKENIQFRCLDFMSDKSLIKDYLKKRKLAKFDAVFCFSITMWIHLNYGDDGLIRFLNEICDLGDFVIIEPQPWKCYRSAVKRLKLSDATFPLFKELQITHDVENKIEQHILTSCKAVKLYESERSEWGRKLQIFKCPPVN